MKYFSIKDGNACFIPESDIPLSDDIKIVSYHPDDEFFVAFLELNGYSGYEDANGNLVWGRTLYVLHYDVSQDKFIPFDRSNKYNVGIYIWYIKLKS